MKSLFVAAILAVSFLLFSGALIQLGKGNW